LNETAWSEFEEHRREIKKPLSNLAREKNAKILANYPGPVQQSMVDATIANRWTGVFPPREKGEYNRPACDSRPKSKGQRLMEQFQ